MSLETWVTTLPCFLHQCTNPGRNWSLGPAAHLLVEKKPVVRAAPFCSKSYVLPAGIHVPHIPAQPQQNSCPEYFSPWFRLSFYIQILCFLFCTAKPCQLNIQEFTFRLYKQFLLDNVFFSVRLQVNYFDRLCLSFLTPVSEDCLHIDTYYSNPPSFIITARWFQWL